MAKDKIEFVKAALRNPFDVSTVFPTSRSLTETMLNLADLANASKVVEVGAGTGAITRHLEKKISKPDVYLGIELDPKMVDFLKSEWPSLRFEAGLAENLPTWAPAGSVDHVVSSLPWTMFSVETQKKTIDAIVSSLRPGGSFLTYICVNALIFPAARTFLSQLHASFGQVKKGDLEWRNIPPAVVFHAIK